MDQKAKNILFQIYWTSKGWKNEYTTDPDELIYAKEKGLMFEPLMIGHDECVRRILEVTDSIKPEKVVKAFLSSLSTRRLDWRSGIASYYIAKQIPEPTVTDISIFKSILSAIDSCQSGDCPSVLRDKLKEIVQFKSNKDERSVIIEILDYIGVLRPLSYDRPEKGK